MKIEYLVTNLAVERKLSPTIQNQAFSAILFLYKEVLGVDLTNENIQAPRVQRRKYILVVLTKDEVQKIISNIDGISNH